MKIKNTCTMKIHTCTMKIKNRYRSGIHNSSSSSIDNINSSTIKHFVTCLAWRKNDDDDHCLLLHFRIPIHRRFHPLRIADDHLDHRGATMNYYHTHPPRPKNIENRKQITQNTKIIINNQNTQNTKNIKNHKYSKPVSFLKSLFYILWVHTYLLLFFHVVKFNVHGSGG